MADQSKNELKQILAIVDAQTCPTFNFFQLTFKFIYAGLRFPTLQNFCNRELQKCLLEMQAELM